MRNLNLRISALILTTTMSCSIGVAQTSANETPEYMSIYGDVFNTDIKQDVVRIQLFQQQDDCTWQIIEDMKSSNYNFVLDRNIDYQVIFTNHKSIKVIHVNSGYTGSYVYRIDANFTSNRSIVMTPNPENSESLYVEYLSYSQAPIKYN